LPQPKSCTAALVDPSSGVYNLFVTTSGGIDHYEKSPAGSRGREIVAPEG
jgi:hypothetical protein